MAGRPNLVVTQEELGELYEHIKKLPFHKIIEQNFVREYEINQEDLLLQNMQLVKKCRYEKNAFEKRISYFNLLKHSTKPTQLEQSILALEKLSTTSADAYFTMHKSLDQIKRSAKNEFLEKNIAVEIEKALDPKIIENKLESRNQRTSELIFLGAAVKKLLLENDAYIQFDEITRIGLALKTAMLMQDVKKKYQGFDQLIMEYEKEEKSQRINKIIIDLSKDPRNPYRK